MSDHTPDSNVPDNHVPDNHVPDSNVPDNHVPDNHIPDNHIPDNGPIVPREAAPEHGPNFWTQLESTMGSETSQFPAAQPATPSLASPPRSAGPLAMSMSAPRRGTLVPLAAAAALLLFVGLGFVLMNRSGDSADTTEVVAGPTVVADEAPLDGPADGGDGSDPAAAADPTVTNTTPAPAPSGDTTTPVATPSGDTTTPVATPSGDTTTVAPTPTGDDSGSAAATAVPTAAPIPDFALAPGATGKPDFLPLDQGVPADGTFVANWPERGVTWYAVTDADRTCASANYSEIRYVNASGFTQEIRDPQLRFSGEISHFTVSNEQNLAAWVVGCGTQLELYVANLEPTGRIVDMTLAWFGEGAVDSALVLWADDEVSLNAIEPGARAFAVEYNVETGLLSRNGGPSRIMIEAGAPAQRSLTALAATSDGGLSYWAGKADPGTVSACLELYGSGQSDMLWLRQGEGLWQPAAVGDFAVGTVTAAAIEPEFLQFAFADVCAGKAGRVVIGTQLPDGRIGDLQTIDLAPYVPGYAAQLFWVDDDTLRIETDNTEYGFGTVRFDYRLDDGVVVQLD